MKRKTTITLTIAGLLALTGIFYAANPRPIAIVNNGGPIGVAASKTDVIASQYCSQKIDKIDCFGNVTVLATIPGGGTCSEKYMTIAPAQSANAGFTPRDIFVTQGNQIFKVSAGPPVTVTLFATLPINTTDHTGI